MICEISFGVETFIGQLLAMLTFFAFPGIQYLILKRFSRRQGKPELWYLPAYGFRLVIRNIPNKRTLSEIKSKTIIRKFIPSNQGSSVATIQDETLIEREDFFLFSGTDQILICFRIEMKGQNKLLFLQTDKLGNSIKEFQLSDFEYLISDYVANIENILNFDIKIAKRVTINTSDLIIYWNNTQSNNIEGLFPCSEITNVE
ncbi:MAG: hypothetical protein ABFD02_04970 [Bacteroidales bacterium]